jgi:26S proteasome regulatory subunit N6
MEMQTPRLQQAASESKKGNLSSAEEIYHTVLSRSAGTNESALREQESALIRLGKLYRDQKSHPPRPTHPVWPIADSRQVPKLVELIKSSRTIMAHFAKAKTAKIGMSRPGFLLGNGLM